MKYKIIYSSDSSDKHKHGQNMIMIKRVSDVIVFQDNFMSNKTRGYPYSLRQNFYVSLRKIFLLLSTFDCNFTPMANVCQRKLRNILTHKAMFVKHNIPFGLGAT